VQELLDLFNMEDLEQLFDSSDQHDQLFVAVSKEAIIGKEGPHAMRLSGMIQGQSVHILVDSGSTHTFLSEHFCCFPHCSSCSFCYYCAYC
jgi:hypothetical protein